MTRALPFHDLAAWAHDYLTPLVSVPVHVRIPATRPTSFVLVRGGGGPQTSIITTDELLDVTTYAATHFVAQQLAREVQLHFNNVVKDATVRRIAAFMGPFDFDDPSGAPAVKTSYRVISRAH